MIFKKIIVDSPRDFSHADIGRVINLFTLEDVKTVKFNNNVYLRLFNLEVLTDVKKFPIIISNHIDLSLHKKITHQAGLAIEVSNLQDIKQAKKHNPDLIIAKSYEAPGVSKECSALILFQLLKQQNCPFSIHAWTGYELFQAYRSLGGYGVILSQQQLQEDITTNLRFSLDQKTSLRLQILGGGDTST